MYHEHESNLVESPSAYHSFHDIELFEPPSPPRHNSQGRKPMDSLDEEIPMTPVKMQRQDSGYESYNGSSPRNSISTSTSSSVYRRPVTRKTSATSSGTSSPSRQKSRPSTHRSAKSYPQPKPRRQQSLYRTRSHTIQPQPTGYFQFPSPEPIELVGTTTTKELDLPPLQLVTQPSAPQMEPYSPSTAPMSPASPPPQTMHYWTSDNTRRLEYAAIDAASRGFTGWVRRTLVPECFVPQESKHVAFDDDTGSVRRYRLDLEDEEEVPDDKVRRRRSWQFWISRKRSG
jgi:hypothetical protein